MSMPWPIVPYVLKAILLFLLFCMGSSRLAAQAAPAGRAAMPASADLTAEEDHRRLLGLLGIKELRPGEEKDANWDEAKANVYTNLPDVLTREERKTGGYGGRVVE